MSLGLSFSSLAEEFQETKKRLREVEDGIQKHTGRPILQQRFKFRADIPPNLRANLAQRLDDGSQRKNQSGGAFSRLGRQLNPQEAQRLGNNHSNNGPPSKIARRDVDAKPEPHKTQEDQVEEEEELPRKKGLLSSIGASSINVKGKSRDELLSAQSGDKKGNARNRRMFGMMLGTLKSFEREETTKRKEQVDKKVEKELKVDEMKEKEREETKRKHRELMDERRMKRIQLKRLHLKMDVVRAFEEFAERHKYMRNFIHTTSQPPIMWLPKNHTSATEKLLEKSRTKIESIISKEEERVKLEIEKIEGVAKDSDGEAAEKENATLHSSITVVTSKTSADNETKSQDTDDIPDDEQDTEVKKPEVPESPIVPDVTKPEDETSQAKDLPEPPSPNAKHTVPGEQDKKGKLPKETASDSSADESGKAQRKRRDSTSSTSSSGSDAETNPHVKEYRKRSEATKPKRSFREEPNKGDRSKVDSKSLQRGLESRKTRDLRGSPNSSPKRRQRTRSPAEPRKRSPRRRR